MTGQASDTAAESQIRGMMDERVEAVRAKDVDALLVHHAPNIVAFDLLVPLRYAGQAAVHTRVQQWFDSYEGKMAYEVRDLAILAGDDVAFCHGLHHVTGTQKSGDKVDMWWRATVCLRKLRDKWWIVHEHSSVPFDITSGKVALDLKP